jgi:excisionase family DNA binding protein
MGTESGPAILTMREAAAFLRIGQATAYRLTAQGILPSIRIPGTTVTRVRRSVLDALLQQWEQGGRRRRGGQ